MTENRKQIPYLHEKRMDGKKIYNYRIWLQPFKENTKKNNIDIGPPIKERAITEGECNLKMKKKTRLFIYGHWDPN